MSNHRKIDDSFSCAPRDPIELIARMLVGSSYRVPTEGRSSHPVLQSGDVAAAVAYMPDTLAQGVVMATALRADHFVIARLSINAYRRVVRAMLQQRPPPLDLRRGADRWRLRMVTYDAAHEIVWPERRTPYGVLAKQAKMRKQAYIITHRCATSVFQQALNEGRREFARRLWND